MKEEEERTPLTDNMCYVKNYAEIVMKKSVQGTSILQRNQRAVYEDKEMESDKRRRRELAGGGK